MWGSEFDIFKEDFGSSFSGVFGHSCLNVIPLRLDCPHTLMHAEMAQVGDIFYIGRYLVSGADTASLYLKAVAVTSKEVVCEAQNHASLNGLLTVFHLERSVGVGQVHNRQNDQPLLAEHDVTMIQALGAEFDIDFLSLSYTR